MKIIIKLLSKLFGGKKPRVIHPENVKTDDPIMAEVVARAFNSGKMVVARRDGNGDLVMTEHEMPK